MSAAAAGCMTEPSLGDDEGAMLYARRAGEFGPAQCFPASGLFEAISIRVKLLVRLGTSPDLVHSRPPPASVALRAHYPSLCAPPHRLGTAWYDPATEQLPTRAGAVELTMVLLSALCTGSFWCIVHSRGGGG
jgi:hypothetical protein